MSRFVDTSEPSKLTDDEKRYLQERGRLPQGVDPVPLNPQFTPLGEQVHTGTANTLGITQEELLASQKRIAELERQLAEKNLEQDQRELKRQKAALQPVDEDDEPQIETYKKSDGWEDDKLQDELRRRGLDPEGDRRELRARLIQDDRTRTNG